MHYYYNNGPGVDLEQTPCASTEETAGANGQPEMPAPEPERKRTPTPWEEPSKRRKKNHSERGAAVLLILLVLVLGGTAVLLAVKAGPLEVESFFAAPAPDILQPASSSSGPEIGLQRAPTGDGTVLTLADRQSGEAMRVQDIYSQVSPSVVFIRSTMAKGIAEGTGVIMSADGYIVTNAHVIEKSFRVEVSLTDGATYEALLVGEDAETDLAVLKIDGQNLPAAVFGNSDQMEVGDTVLAIGNPMGEELRGTMTDGMISAINRDMKVDGVSMTLIQTTAALNTGNSGGALVNEVGQVIGITNMKIMAYDSTVEGLGFAIPSTTVKLVADSLIASGVVTGRPVLGITVQSMSPAEREAQGLEHGLWVKAVEEKADAWRQGIREGDVLLTANGADLDVNDDLLTVRQTLQVGDAIAFQVWRDGETLDVAVKLMDQYQLKG